MTNPNHLKYRDPEAWRRKVRRERIFFSTILGLVLAASGALIAYNRYTARTAGTGLYIAKPEKITPSVVLLQQYIRIDTSHGNEIDGARWLAAQLDAAHVPYEIIESAPGRASLYARIRGTQRGGGLMLLSHIDVVPASPAGWTRPPLAGEIYLNQLWGRGALDMKSITICQLQAFLDIARSGRTPAHDLVLLAVADEERGSHLGIRWLLEHRRDVIDGITYVLNEGGVTETIAEKINYFGIEIGTKQVIGLDVEAPSREALLRFRIALEPYFLRYSADEVLPPVARYFAAIAPNRIEPRPWLADVHKTIAEGELWRLPRGYRELLQNIVWAYAPRPEDGRWRMRVHMIDLPGTQPAARVAWLRGYAARYGVAAGPVLEQTPVTGLSSDRTPLFRIIIDEIHHEYGSGVPAGIQMLAGSANDSRFLRPLGLQCYGMWPFPVDFYQTGGIHGIDERVRLDWFEQGVELTRRIVERYVT
jgi:acetylornithine deacetylase/succinyl-diaminopimelate desuccinylase-like protein